MGNISNNAIMTEVNKIAVDVAIIKELVPKIECLYNDAYIGNGQPPWRATCRAYVDDKKTQETAKTVAATNRLDFSNKVKLQIVGGVIALVTAQTGLVLAAINWIPKLFGN